MLDRNFDGSLAKAMQTTYPEHEWLPWRFQQRVSPGYWENKEHQKKFFDWLGKEMGYTKMDDYYHVTVQAIKKYGGGPILDKHDHSFSKTLQSVYPQHD